MRELFMEPDSLLRVKEALLSLLAGNIHGKTPVWGALRIMKVIYYMAWIDHLGRNWRVWKRRRINIRGVEVPAP